jgi:hypothetical protein
MVAPYASVSAACKDIEARQFYVDKACYGLSLITFVIVPGEIARPLTADCNAIFADGKPTLWVISGHFVTSGGCPLYPAPRKRTFDGEQNSWN